MSDNESWMMTLAGGVYSAVTFLALLGLVIVCAVVVRAHRPDAWLLLLSAALVELGGSVLSTILRVAGPALTTALDTHPYRFYAATTLLGACVQVVFWTLLVIGIIRLARPPPAPLRGAVRPL